MTAAGTWDKMGFRKRGNMDKLLKVVTEQNEEAESSFQLKRIADAIEEILRIVKKDMEPKNEKNKIQK